MDKQLRKRLTDLHCESVIVRYPHRLSQGCPGIGPRTILHWGFLPRFRIMTHGDHFGPISKL